jgi:hypothetical protein
MGNDMRVYYLGLDSSFFGLINFEVSEDYPETSLAEESSSDGFGTTDAEGGGTSTTKIRMENLPRVRNRHDEHSKAIMR